MKRSDYLSLITLPKRYVNEAKTLDLTVETVVQHLYNAGVKHQEVLNEFFCS